jgi:hypothetical protein
MASIDGLIIGYWTETRGKKITELEYVSMKLTKLM